MRRRGSRVRDCIPIAGRIIPAHHRHCAGCISDCLGVSGYAQPWGIRDISSAVGRHLYLKLAGDVTHNPWILDYNRCLLRHRRCKSMRIGNSSTKMVLVFNRYYNNSYSGMGHL